MNRSTCNQMTRSTCYERFALLSASSRSGSTFLANLIRSHREVRYFNEIISRGATFLPAFERELAASRDPSREVFEADLNSLHRCTSCSAPLALSTSHATCWSR